MNDSLLVQAVINQIEDDWAVRDYSSLKELISYLITEPHVKDKLVSYLSDTCRKNWLAGNTVIRY